MDAELQAAYAASVLELDLPDGTRVTVEPRPPGVRAGTFPDGLTRVDVITAANPASDPLPDAANAARNRDLEAQLRHRRLVHTHAVGRSPDGSWSEASFAVFDADDEAVLQLARDHGQHAVFRWTPAALEVVTAAGRTITSRGWHRR